jgi:hypothetical protein
MVRPLRSAFTPDALATFDETMDEVWSELLADGVLSPGAGQTRTRLARKLITCASGGWSAAQIKQLLLRALRNERSAALHKTGSRGNGRSRF